MAATARTIRLTDVPEEVALAVQPVIRTWELAALRVASDRNASWPAGSTEALLHSQLSRRPQSTQAIATSRSDAILTASRFPGRVQRQLGVELKPGMPSPTVPLSFGFSADLKAILEDLAKKVAAAASKEDGAATTTKTYDFVQLFITSLRCIDETNGFLGSESGEDEISIGGTLVDSDGNTSPVNAVNLGSDWDDGNFKVFNPHKQLLRLSLRGGLKFPRAVFVTLVLAERDGAGDFQSFINTATDKIAEQAKTSLAAALGAAVGSTGGPVGILIGLAVGYAIGKIVEKIKNSWADDLFVPVTIELQLPSRQSLFANGSEDIFPARIVFAGPGEYRAQYRWQLMDVG